MKIKDRDVKLNQVIFALDCYNPLYLDKTGEFINKTDDYSSHNVNIGPEGYNFFSKRNNKVFLNIKKFSVSFDNSTTRKNYTDDNFLFDLESYSKELLDIYGEISLKRLGTRLIKRIEINEFQSKDILKKIISPSFSDTFQNVSSANLKIKFDNQNDSFCNLNLYYGKRVIDFGIEEMEEEGLIFDFDDYIFLRDEKSNHESLKKILDFYKSSKLRFEETFLKFKTWVEKNV